MNRWVNQLNKLSHALEYTRLCGVFIHSLCQCCPQLWNLSYSCAFQMSRVYNVITESIRYKVKERRSFSGITGNLYFNVQYTVYIQLYVARNKIISSGLRLRRRRREVVCDGISLPWLTAPWSLLRPLTFWRLDFPLLRHRAASKILWW